MCIREKVRLFDNILRKSCHRIYLDRNIYRGIWKNTRFSRRICLKRDYSSVGRDSRILCFFIFKPYRHVDSAGWDIAWPEAFRALLRQGVEVVIVPTYWVFQDVGEVGQAHDPQYVASPFSWFNFDNCSSPLIGVQVRLLGSIALW
jgi:hypothetical protein